MNRMIFAVLLLAFSSIAVSSEDELSRAAMLAQHGLIRDAKLAYINLMFRVDDDTVRAKCLYELGMISFREDDIGMAINTWRTLIEEFPDSEEGKAVKERIDVLSSKLEEVLVEHSEDETASLYLDNADFFSNRIRDDSWGIDTSWLSNEDMAFHWYDKVIAEFPKTNAAHRAYVRKFKTLVGSSGRSGGGFKAAAFGGGDYGDYGNKKAARNYMALMVFCFEDYMLDFPDGVFANRMRFQIGQSHWILNDNEKATLWLKKIVDSGQGDDDLYVYVAKQRMANLDKR